MPDDNTQMTSTNPPTDSASPVLPAVSTPQPSPGILDGSDSAPAPEPTPTPSPSSNPAASATPITDSTIPPIDDPSVPPIDMSVPPIDDSNIPTAPPIPPMPSADLSTPADSSTPIDASTPTDSSAYSDDHTSEPSTPAESGGPASSSPLFAKVGTAAPVTISPADTELYSEIASKISDSKNVLIALSSDPSVDELAAAIGLSLYLDKLGKRATAIYSGATPNALEFLKPEETFESSPDTLQDFVIALNKEKADHLRYKLDGDFVKIYITPYKTRLSEEDLDFSYGDYNVDLVLALDVANGIDLDSSLREHGRIMHDAIIINITTGKPGKFGEIEWSEKASSSVSEMISRLLYSASSDVEISKDEATAFLTGIVAATNRFSNASTTPETMRIASKLMESGANQQLVAKNITPDIENEMATTSLKSIPTKEEEEEDGDSEESSDPTKLSIKHDIRDDFDESKEVDGTVTEKQSTLLEGLKAAEADLEGKDTKDLDESSNEKESSSEELESEKSEKTEKESKNESEKEEKPIKLEKKPLISEDALEIKLTNPKNEPKEEPKNEEIKEAPKEEPKEEPKNEEVKEEPKEELKEEVIQEAPKEEPKEESKEEPKEEKPKEETKEEPKPSGEEPSSDEGVHETPEKVIQPPADMDSGESDSDKYSHMLEEALNSFKEVEANTNPTMTPVDSNPAAMGAPSVPSNPEINGVPEMNYMPMPGDEILPPPPTPPIDMSVGGMPTPQMPPVSTGSPTSEPAQPTSPATPASAPTSPMTIPTSTTDASAASTESTPTSTPTTDPGAFKIPGM